MSLLLTVDVGNTSTHAGVFDGDQRITDFRFATDPTASADALGLFYRGLLDLNQVDHTQIQAVAMATVVPPLIRRYREMADRYFGGGLFVLNAAECGIEIDYDPPGSVGADRIANAVAALERVGAPVIIADFGTATTIDALDSAGRYLGGAIALGPEPALAGLYARTAQLPMVDLRLPQNPIGKSTQDSIRSGIIYGLAALVDGLVMRFREQMGCEAPTLATGGVAPLVVSGCRTVSDVVMDLTLQGIRLAWERANRTGSL